MSLFLVRVESEVLNTLSLKVVKVCDDEFDSNSILYCASLSHQYLNFCSAPSHLLPFEVNSSYKEVPRYSHVLGDRSLLSWGLNQHGQCGVSTSLDVLREGGMENFKLNSSGHVTHVYTPVRVRGVALLTEVHCGWSHTLVVTGNICSTKI